MRALAFITTLSLALWCVALSLVAGLAARNHELSAWFGGASFVLVIIALTIYVFPGDHY
jgi:hypothetical protein